MLLRGLIRPLANWPLGHFRAPQALVLDAAPSLRLDRQDHSTDLHPVPGNSDAADRLYCGRYDFAGETVAASPEELFSLSHPSAFWRKERDDLGWFRHFAAAPRRLHVYFVARLLTSWMKVSHASRNVATESRRLDHIAATIHALGVYAGTREQAIFGNALQLQCGRLLHLNPHNAAEAVLQSLSVLAVACGEELLAAPRDKAWRQLTSSLPQVVLEDGSEVSGDTDKAIALAHSLAAFLAESAGAPVPLPIMAACDRLLAYVAMFRLGPGLWSTAVSVPVPEELETFLGEVHALGHANHGGRTLLEQGGTKILAHWGADFQKARLEISHRGKPVICIGHGAEGPLLAAKGADRQVEAGRGELASMQWSRHESSRGKSVYLSADGNDIRFEECWQGTKEGGIIILKLPSQAKVLMTHDATKAGFVLADDSYWQLKVRGARVAKAGPGLALHFSPVETESQSVCWALKRLPPRTHGGRSQRGSAPESELPF
jgi:hypothetical protein